MEKLLATGSTKGINPELFCGLDLSGQGLREDLHRIANELMTDLVLKKACLGEKGLPE